MKIAIQCLCLLALLLSSCEDENVFGVSPSQRSAQSIDSLRNELVNAPYGWRVTYFPKTDSLLFSNVSELIGQFTFENQYGFGGHVFQMRFSDNGIVEMIADFNEESLIASRLSEFEVGRNTFTQLSFTTYTYLHQLVNDTAQGSSDFLYVGKDEFGDLVFKTASYIEPAREYIVFRKLQSEDEWTNSIRTSYDNLKFFEAMTNPQLSIHRASREYFTSDMDMKYYQKTNLRYHLFMFAKTPAALTGSWPAEVVGLGSGYVGTTDGISFRAGLRYSSTYMFFDFQRVGNRFVCELVRVYNPYNRTNRLVSKHLYPDGEETGMVAEIYDAGQ